MKSAVRRTGFARGFARIGLDGAMASIPSSLAKTLFQEEPREDISDRRRGVHRFPPS